MTTPILSDEELMLLYYAERPNVGELLTVAVYKDGVDVARPTLFYRGLAEAIAARARTTAPAPIIQFVDRWGATHTLTLAAAVREIKTWYDAWPGGPSEVEAALKTQRALAPESSIALTTKPLDNSPPGQGHKLYYYNGVYMGDVLRDADGYFKFWPEPRKTTGFWTEGDMLAVAAHLQTLNAEWDATVRREVGP